MSLTKECSNKMERKIWAIHSAMLLAPRSKIRHNKSHSLIAWQPKSKMKLELELLIKHRAINWPLSDEWTHQATICLKSWCMTIQRIIISMMMKICPWTHLLRQPRSSATITIRPCSAPLTFKATVPTSRAANSACKPPGTRSMHRPPPSLMCTKETGQVQTMPRNARPLCLPPQV